MGSTIDVLFFLKTLLWRSNCMKVQVSVAVRVDDGGAPGIILFFGSVVNVPLHFGSGGHESRYQRPAIDNDGYTAVSSSVRHIFYSNNCWHDVVEVEAKAWSVTLAGATFSLEVTSITLSQIYAHVLILWVYTKLFIQHRGDFYVALGATFCEDILVVIYQCSMMIQGRPLI
jgi:hypothetical protein